MAFPNGARLRTYAPGDMVQSDDINKMQDADIAVYDEVFNKRLEFLDSFTGQSINTFVWKTPTGTVSIVDDSANGANGCGKVDASAGGSHNIETQPLALPGDFRLRGRLRITGVTGSSSIAFGFRGTNEVAFLIDGTNSTTNWRALITGTGSTPANGTPAAINATYLEFEIKRVGTLITMSINGVVFHTVTSATMTSDTVRVSAIGAGIVFADRVSLLA